MPESQSHVPARIHPSADVESGASIGPGTVVWNCAQVRSGAVVGRECTIGSGAYIGEGTRLGDLVKVGNHADVFGATVGDGAFISPHALLMEDAAPRAVNPDGSRKGPADWERRPAVVGVGATVGGGARVLPGVQIGEWAMVAAGAVVHRDVPNHAIVAGNPARQVGWACHCGQSLDNDLTCPTCGRRHEGLSTGLVERPA